MQELVGAIAAYEDMSLNELSKLVQNAAYDQFSLRVEHLDVLDGSIPLNDGIDLTINSRDLLAAAGNAVISKRKVYSGRQPAEVSAYLSKTRLGQTERGSYVVNIFSRIDEPAGDKSASFDVAVSRVLDRALSALKKSLAKYRESTTPIVFEEGLSDGVSSNLCEALLRVFGERSHRDVTISFCPGVGRRIFKPDAFIHRFASGDAAAIRIAAEYFKEVYTLPSIEVSGYIKRLDRDIDAAHGNVWIHTMLPNEHEKNVQVQLSAEEYIQAIHAHENNHIVSCVGDVIVNPRSARLIEMRQFKVIGGALPLKS